MKKPLLCLVAVKARKENIVSDNRFRELERRWKETGSEEDEARLLQERVRCGNLTKNRLCLAAMLGHQAARMAVEQQRSIEPGDLVQQTFRLSGLEGLVRLACTAAACQLCRDPIARQDIEAMKAILTALRSRSEEDIQRMMSFGRALARNEETSSVFYAEGAVCSYLKNLAFSEGWTVENTVTDRTHRALAIAEDAILAHHFTPEEMEQAMADALIPWLLGYGDPVLEPDFLPPL